MVVIRTERGWPGHFVCAAECMFRRNTLLECGERRVIVSTVGSWESGIKSESRYTPIGHQRWHETMAFEAEREGPYWDADVTREVGFESPWSLGEDVDDNAVNAMHEAVVAELMARLEKERGDD